LKKNRERSGAKGNTTEEGRRKRKIELRVKYGREKRKSGEIGAERKWWRKGNFTLQVRGNADLRERLGWRGKDPAGRGGPIVGVGQTEVVGGCNHSPGWKFGEVKK